MKKEVSARHLLIGAGRNPFFYLPSPETGKRALDSGYPKVGSAFSSPMSRGRCKGGPGNSQLA